MGNANCCCCANDEDAKKDSELDKYLTKYHKEQPKMSKFDKNDFVLAK